MIRILFVCHGRINAKAKNGGNKPFVGRVVSDLHLLR